MTSLKNLPYINDDEQIIGNSFDSVLKKFLQKYPYKYPKMFRQLADISGSHQSDDLNRLKQNHCDLTS